MKTTCWLEGFLKATTSKWGFTQFRFERFTGSMTPEAHSLHITAPLTTFFVSWVSTFLKVWKLAGVQHWLRWLTAGHCCTEHIAQQTQHWCRKQHTCSKNTHRGENYKDVHLPDFMSNMYMSFFLCRWKSFAVCYKDTPNHEYSFLVVIAITQIESVTLSTLGTEGPCSDG